MVVETWKVTCGSCNHAWKLNGNWSEYERQAIESRPCPNCSAYTLSSPEPKAKKKRRSPWMLVGGLALSQAQRS